MTRVNILWTGGLDSTFRILELSKYDVEIQPYYVIDKGRKSVKYEKRAMEKIRQDVINNPATKAVLMPVRWINKSDIAPNTEITEAWKSLKERYSIGSQYDWLARFAQANNLTLEVCLEKSNRSKAVAALTGESQLREDNLDGVSVMAIDKTTATREAYLIFGNFVFPSSLWNMTKEEEVELYKKWGFEHTVKKTWFCHAPIFGFPCGHCHPCQDALNEGMAFRVPRVGIVLGSIRHLFRTVVKFNKG